MRATGCIRTALLLAVSASAPASNADAARIGEAVRSRTHDAAPPSAFRFTPEVRCTRGTSGARDCRIGDYWLRDDDLTCPPDAPVFGRIFGGAVDLLDRFPEAGAHPVARLHDRQFVCIAADVGIEPGVSSWSYVVALPTKLIPDCRGASLCWHADFPVRFFGRRSGTACDLDRAGKYTEGCPAGWVRSDHVDAYSMGIRPIGD